MTETNTTPEAGKRNISIMLPIALVDEIDKKADLDDRARGPFIGRQLKLAFKYKALIDYIETLDGNVERLRLTFMSSLIREILKSPEKAKTGKRRGRRPKQKTPTEE